MTFNGELGGDKVVMIEVESAAVPLDIGWMLTNDEVDDNDPTLEPNPASINVILNHTYIAVELVMS
jgi:hypothetical protein